MKNSFDYSLSRIYLTSFFPIKIFWILAFSLCLATSIFKKAKFCAIYLQYPVVINIDVLNQQKLEFPAVTVCNLNRKRGEETFLNGIISEGGPLMFSERGDLYNCNKYKNSSIIKEAKSNYLDFLKEWNNLHVDQRYAAGHYPSRFIHECIFNGKICSKEYLSNFNNYRYGNCVIFHEKTNFTKVLSISGIGIANGLLLILDLEDRLYMESTPTIGAKLIIHEPEKIPTPEGKGYLITPGFEFRIGLKQTVFKRLPAPYKDHCVDYKTRSKEFAGSKNECIRKCIQMTNFDHCGCIDPTFDIMNDFKSCDFSNETEICCLDDVLEYMSEKGSSCNCLLPCRSVSYREQLSKSRLRRSRETHDEARVKIFYPSFETLVYEQRPR